MEDFNPIIVKPLTGEESAKASADNEERNRKAYEFFVEQRRRREIAQLEDELALADAVAVDVMKRDQASLMNKKTWQNDYLEALANLDDGHTC